MRHSSAGTRATIDWGDGDDDGTDSQTSPATATPLPAWVEPESEERLGTTDDADTDTDAPAEFDGPRAPHNEPETEPGGHVRFAADGTPIYVPIQPITPLAPPPDETEAAPDDNRR